MGTHKIVELKDGSKGTIFFIEKDCANVIPRGIHDQLMALYNEVIEAGQTYPAVYPAKDDAEFESAWLHYSCVVLVAGEQDVLADDQTVLGTYYVKPNYIGRCSHVCNAGFLVSPSARGKNVGKALGQSYLDFAPKLGYTYSVFNLVFVTNVASWKIWDALGFDRIGYVPGVARLKGIEGDVDAIIFGKKLI